MPYGRTYTNPAFATDLISLFDHQLRASNLGTGETCWCVTDTAWNPAYAAACVGAATAIGADVWQTMFTWNAPPPSAVLRANCEVADLIVYMTSHTLHYRDEIRHALDRGARVLCCMEQPHVIDRLRADPEVRQRALNGAALLDKASQISIKTDAGTDLTMDKAGRAGLANYGAADAPGQLDFCGLGAVQAAQREGSTQGRLVLDIGDSCFHLGRFIEQRVTMDFEDGKLVSIEGGLDAALIRAELDAAGDTGAWMAGHMAWGVDHRARWTQTVAQTPDFGGGGADNESFYGNVQVQLGSNDDVMFGGANRSRAHLGLCLRNASLSLDGQPVIKNGAFVPQDLQ